LCKAEYDKPWREEGGQHSAWPCEAVTLWKMEKANLDFSSTWLIAPVFAVGKTRCWSAGMKSPGQEAVA